jgi:hypothetical protein
MKTPRRRKAAGAWAIASARKPGTSLTNQKRSRKRSGSTDHGGPAQVVSGGEVLRQGAKVGIVARVARGLGPLEDGGMAETAKADREELFVASLSSCHMLWFIPQGRIRVTSRRAWRGRGRGSCRPISSWRLCRGYRNRRRGEPSAGESDRQSEGTARLAGTPWQGGAGCTGPTSDSLCERSDSLGRRVRHCVALYPKISMALG